MTLLKINGLKSGYDRLQVLDNLSLSIDPDSINVMIGPNGAGKSTVLKSIFNMCDIYAGSIRFANIDITRLPTHERIALGISLVPQSRQVFGTLTVEENLLMGAYLTKDRDLISEKQKEVLAHFPQLKSKLDSLAWNLSGGEQQMVAIARALMQDPKLLLLDEPSLGLAPKMMGFIFKKLQDIRKEGTTILMVEQNAKSACSIADNILLLEEGRIALKGGKSILQNPKLRQIYLGGHGHK